jgi:molecular chaperone GrpE
MSEPSEPTEGANDSGGVIPVEVDAPEAASAAATVPVEAPKAEPPPDPTAELNAKIAVLEKEKKDNWDRYLRAAADLENMRKRTKRELEDTRFDTKNKVLKEMLPVVDNLERAIEHAGAGVAPEADAATKAIVEGVQLVLRQFVSAFERLDIKPIEALGQPFDPNLHEAISQQDSDQPPGTIVQVLQRGYRAGERLLRPTLVVVAKAKAAPDQSE